jgi:hypothetical protein
MESVPIITNIVNFEIPLRLGVLNTTLCDKVCPWLVAGRSVVFSGYSNFLHQWNWPPRHNWNIVESGIKHHNPPYRYIHSTTYLTGSKPSLKNKLSKHKEINSKSNCNTFQYLHFITLILNVSSDNNNLVDSHEVKYTVQIIFTTNPEKKWCKSTCVFVFWYTVLHLSWQWVSTTISHIIVPYSKQKWYLYIYI